MNETKDETTRAQLPRGDPSHQRDVDDLRREWLPQTYRFSDRSCGCLWITPITCGFRDCKRSSSVVIFGYLDVFCDHKVSKRSTAHCDQLRSWTLGLVWHLVDLAQHDTTWCSGDDILPRRGLSLSCLPAEHRVVGLG